MRIYQYYLPVYYWCRQQLDLHRKEKGTSQPLVIGMQAPQVLLPCAPLPCSSLVQVFWRAHAVCVMLLLCLA